MIADSMVSLVKNSSVIRAMFEEGNRLAKLYGAENVYDFSLGNPNVPAPAEVNEAVKDIVDNEESTFIHGYMSNAGYEDVRQTIAESLNRRFGTHFNHTNIVMTVGAAGGLNTIFKTLLNPGEEVMTFAPFFGEYRNYVSNFGGKLVVVSPNTVDFQPKLDEFEAKITPKTRAVIVNNPNNPTGTYVGREKVIEFIKKVPDDVIVLMDEAYLEFATAEDCQSMYPLIKELPDKPIIVLKTFSKYYGMAGVRVGYALAAPELIAAIEKCPSAMISKAGQAGAIAALADQQYYQEVKKKLVEGMTYLETEMEKLGCKVYHSQTNFILFDPHIDAQLVRAKLMEAGIMISAPGICRVSVSTMENNRLFIETLKNIMGK